MKKTYKNTKEYYLHNYNRIANRKAKLTEIPITLPDTCTNCNQSNTTMQETKKGIVCIGECK